MWYPPPTYWYIFYDPSLKLPKILDAPPAFLPAHPRP